MFLCEISVFSAEPYTEESFYLTAFPVIVLLLVCLLTFSLFKNFSGRKKSLKAKKESEQEARKVIEKEDEIVFLNTQIEAEKKRYQSIMESVRRQNETNSEFYSAIASGSEKNIEQAMKKLVPEIEKVLIKSFAKGERITIDELGIDFNRQKVLTLEKSVLFEGFDKDKSDKKIFFFPVKGEQQNIGAVIILLKDECQTDDSFIMLLNNFGYILSTKIIRNKYEKYTQDFQQNLILSLVNILELYDKNEKGHSERVAKTAVEIGEALKLPQSDIIKIYWVAMIHDIGKIFLPYSLRSKRGRMTAKEFELFQNHSLWGEKIICTNDELEDISSCVRHHHERWDGKGYPDRLEGKNIPIISRIITVADSYDNIRYRSYESMKTEDDGEALERIAQNSGKALDPEIVEVFLKLKSDEKEDGIH